MNSNALVAREPRSGLADGTAASLAAAHALARNREAPAYRLVIFDFDGTLADSRSWFMRTLNDVAGDFGFRRVSDHELEMLRGKSNREIIRYLEVPVWKMPAIAREMRRRSAVAAGAIRLYEGVPELLQRLGRSVHIAVVSSNGEETVRRVLGPSAALVDHYSCSASIFGKATRLRALRRQLRLQPDEVIVVGDEPRDVEAAHQAGIPSVAVTWGYATEAALRRSAPSFVAKTIAELAELIGDTPGEGGSHAMPKDSAPADVAEASWPRASR